NTQVYKGEDRSLIEKTIQPGGVIYEPGKCVKCGLCVRITAKSKERLGLAFIGRGFQVKVAVPFDEPLSAGLELTAAACVEACPTGALSFMDAEEI
ncbi:hypothetical protein ACFL4L_06675, partial [bacterium]